MDHITTTKPMANFWILLLMDIEPTAAATMRIKPNAPSNKGIKGNSDNMSLTTRNDEIKMINRPVH